MNAEKLVTIQPLAFRKFLNLLYLFKLDSQTESQTFIFNPKTSQFEVNVEVFLRFIRYQQVCRELFIKSEQLKLEALEDDFSVSTLDTGHLRGHYDNGPFRDPVIHVLGLLIDNFAIIMFQPISSVLMPYRYNFLL
ncbi:hypothetical protein HMI56_000024 [Coelomomyces lativittatus]|nr:hypothetical protein HMI56_000024 [Coelomomyces lativittatus]